MPPPELRFDYARFLNIRAAYGPSFLTDGRLAFVSTLTGVPQAFAVPLVSSGAGAADAHFAWPEQLTFTQDRIGAVHASPVDERMVVTQDRGGDERFQLYLISGHGEVVIPLTDQPEAMFHFGGWSPDGRQIAFTGNQRDPRCFDIYVQTLDGLEAEEARLAAQTDGMYSVAGWSPDGAHLLVTRSISNSEQDLFELSLADGTMRHLTPRASDERSALWAYAHYASDSRSIYVATDRETDTLSLVRLDRETLAVQPLSGLPAWDVEDARVSPDGNRLAYVMNAEGYSNVYVRDLASGETRQIDVPRGVIGLGRDARAHDVLAWSREGRRLAFSLAAASRTRNVWLVDLGQDQSNVIQVTAATQAGIPLSHLVEPKLVKYPTIDGREIPAFLYTPRGAKPDGSHPAVVIFHGGPESQIRPQLSPDVQYFTQHGYVVLTPNVRGSSGYGRTYQSLDDVEKRMDSVTDGRNAAMWLAEAGWAHPQRIACMGGSYGGFMVLSQLTTYPETWAAGVDLVGIANFVTFLENTHPFRRRHREAEYGSLEHHRDLLEQISPIRAVDRIKAPLFAAHGDNDPRVPVGETVQIVEALQARGVPTELMRFPDEGHGVVKLANRLRLYPSIAAFLDRYVRGG